MTEVIITTNAPLVSKALEDLTAEIPVISRGRMFGRAESIARRLRQYPPAPAASTYVRTFALRDSVTVTRNDDGYTVTADPVDPKGKHYGVYPLGSFGVAQAWMHVNRWVPMVDIVDQELSELPAEIEDAISTWWAQNSRS